MRHCLNPFEMLPTRAKLLLLLLVLTVIQGCKPPEPKPFPPEPNSIGGVVWCDADSDAVPDSGEKGLSSITVKLVKVGPAPPPPVVATTAAPSTPEPVNFAGAYIFRTVSPGTYHVEVDESTLPGAVGPPPNQGTPTPQVSMGPGSAVNNIHFGYAPKSGQSCP